MLSRSSTHTPELLVGCEHISDLIRAASPSKLMELETARNLSQYASINMVRVSCDYSYRAHTTGGRQTVEMCRYDQPISGECIRVSDYAISYYCSKCRYGTTSTHLDAASQVALAKKIIGRFGSQLKQPLTKIIRAFPCTYLSSYLLNKNLRWACENPENGSISQIMERGLTYGPIRQVPYAYFRDSCYLNSIMQALISCPPYVDSLLRTRIGSVIGIHTGQLSGDGYLGPVITDELERRVMTASFSQPPETKSKSAHGDLERAILEQREELRHLIPSRHSGDFEELILSYGDRQSQQPVEEIMRKVLNASIFIAKGSTVINNRDCMTENDKDISVAYDSEGHFLFNDNFIRLYHISTDINGAVMVGKKLANSGLSVARGSDKAEGVFGGGIQRGLYTGWFGKDDVIVGTDMVNYAEPGICSFTRVESLKEAPPSVVIPYGHPHGLRGFSKFDVNSIIISYNHGHNSSGYGSGHIKCLSKSGGDHVGWVLYDDSTSTNLTQSDASGRIPDTSEDYQATVDLMLTGIDYCECLSSLRENIKKGRDKKAPKMTHFGNYISSKSLTIYHCIRNFMSSYIDYHIVHIDDYKKIVAECDMIKNREREYMDELQNINYNGMSQEDLLFAIIDSPYHNKAKPHLNVPSLSDPHIWAKDKMLNACCKLLVIGQLYGVIEKAKPTDFRLDSACQFYQRFRFMHTEIAGEIGTPIQFPNRPISTGATLQSQSRGWIILDHYVFKNVSSNHLIIRGIALLRRPEQSSYNYPVRSSSRAPSSVNSVSSSSLNDLGNYDLHDYMEE